MPVPINLLDDYPEDWNDLVEAINLAASLSDQLNDVMLRREPEGIEQIKITPAGPKDTDGILMAIVQQEMTRLKNENASLANAVRANDSANQVFAGKLKTILKRLEKLETKRPRKSGS